MATRQQYLELKSELKQLAQTLKIKKFNQRASMPGCTRKLMEETEFSKAISFWKAYYEYRHKHIVISLLRGKTREQIEKPKEGNEPNETYITTLMELYATVDETVRISS